MVMATGIVSAALLQDGFPAASVILLWVAGAGFAVLLAVSCWRAAAVPGLVRADIARPDRAFTSFAFVAACGVLGSGLAGHGLGGLAGALAWTALLAWIGLTCLVPLRMAIIRPAITDVNGTWYLWTVGTQTLAVAAAYCAGDRLLPTGPAAAAALTAWSAGVLAYLGICVLALARLRRARPGRGEAKAPWWVAMGAASISILAAARVLDIAGDPMVTAARPVVNAVSIGLWAVATALIPVLVVAVFGPRLLAPRRPRYWPGMWVVVFPLGMYATASLQIGRAAGVPLIHAAGVVAVWPAAAAWAITFALMAAAPVRRGLAGAERTHR
jgi:tellurite resistance protein TehA-like permease